MLWGIPGYLYSGGTRVYTLGETRVLWGYPGKFSGGSRVNFLGVAGYILWGVPGYILWGYPGKYSGEYPGTNSGGTQVYTLVYPGMYTLGVPVYLSECDPNNQVWNPCTQEYYTLPNTPFLAPALRKTINTPIQHTSSQHPLVPPSHHPCFHTVTDN